MKIIERKRNWINLDVASLPATTGVIQLVREDLIADQILIMIDHDALSGSGGESLIISPKLVFADDLVAAAQQFACKLYDHNGGVVGAAITITGTGAAGAKWFYVVCGANTTSNSNESRIIAPALLFTIANTNYTSGDVRFHYLIGG